MAISREIYSNSSTSDSVVDESSDGSGMLSADYIAQQLSPPNDVAKGLAPGTVKVTNVE